MVAPLDGHLREEILALKKKVVALETAESDNERLRKELSKLKIAVQEEKSQVELEFMNQLAEVMRENAMKLEEVTGRLHESNKVNQSLSEQLRSGEPSPEDIEKRFRDLESRHEHEMSRLVLESNRNSSEMERMKHELDDVRNSRDELAAKLRESEDSTSKDHPVGRISAGKSPLQESISIPQPQLQKEYEALKKELEASVNSLKEKGTLISGFEDENRKLRNAMEALRQKKEESKSSIKPLESDIDKKNAQISELENQIRDLRQYVKHIEDENKDQKIVSHRETREDGELEPQSNKNLLKKKNRASRLIQQFEKNLKSDGHTRKVNTSEVKSNVQKTKLNTIEIQSLKGEVKRLNERLENERNRASELRKTIEEFTASTREIRNVNALGNNSAVKGIANTFENRMGQNGNPDSVSSQRSVGSIDDVPSLAKELTEVKDELKVHWEQVHDLETELANQCEINCALVEEINTLTQQNSSTGSSNAHECQPSKNQNDGDDQKEIERLRMEVAEIKARLFSSTEAQSALESEIGRMTKNHQGQIENYERQLQSLQGPSGGGGIENSMAKATERDHQVEKEKFESQIHQLKTKLSGVKHRAEDYKMRVDEATQETCALKERNDVLEKEKKSNSKSMVDYKLKISELEANLLSTKNNLADEMNKSTKEMAGLNFKFQTLTETLAGAEESRASLTLEKEQLLSEVNRVAKKKKRLEEEAKQQTQQLKDLKKMLDEKLKTVENRHEKDELEIKILKNQVASLELDLSEAREVVGQLQKNIKETKEMENAVEDLSRENTNTFHEQINKLQRELTMKHMQLSELEPRHKKEIDKLENTIDSVRLEMGEVVKKKDAEIEKLKNDSDNKDSTSLRLEKEKEQLVLTMQDMMKNRRNEVDDLQNELMEMNTRLADQTREISSLKAKLEDSNYESKEIGRLRARVADLSHELATKNDADDRFGPLEIENNDLRRRLEEASTERWLAEDKLQKYISEKESERSSRSVQVLRERNAALKLEVEKLTKKLKKLSEKVSRDSNSVEIDTYSLGNGVTRMVI